jgi:hypothetical protein
MLSKEEIRNDKQGALAVKVTLRRKKWLAGKKLEITRREP